jgi:deferrochelatase/peroxidase EfeB
MTQSTARANYLMEQQRLGGDYSEDGKDLEIGEDYEEEDFDEDDDEDDALCLTCEHTRRAHSHDENGCCLCDCEEFKWKEPE